ncbi:MAG: acyltransferase [Cetobacterium sp.]|uniref:acyltransferase n=1 Tax=Cetobacterium sp. TaxID=2071632 RepID=UPI003F33A2CB
MQRNNSLDTLRVFACFLVVLLHVSAGYVLKNINSYNIQFTIGNFYDSLSRISVPIFVMLSGAFILDNSKNKSFIYFYKKSFYKIIIPTFIWSLVYILYIRILNYKTIDFNYINLIKNWFYGRPYYHLWYMYMAIGLYAVAPVIVLIKDEVEERDFFKAALIILLFNMVTSRYSTLFWLIQFNSYIGYFMLGYALKSYYTKNKFDVRYSIGVWILSVLAIFIITEVYVKYNIFEKTLYFYNNLSPFVIIGSIFAFITFLNLDIKSKYFEYMSKYTFNIYLIHAGILTFIDIILAKFELSFNGIWYIPIMSIVIFKLSFIGAYIVNSIEENTKNIALNYKNTK